MDNRTGTISSRDDTTLKQSAGVLRASKLIGTVVYGQNDKRLGTIHDVVLNSDLKHVDYAVLSYGGIAGLDDKLFAVPARQIQYSSDRALLPLDIQVLKNAPGFDKKNWPDQANADFLHRLDQYYGKNGVAQSDQTMDQGARDTDKAITGVDTTARPAGAEMDHGIVWDRRVSKLIGATVEQPDGKSIGEVKDVVLDWNAGSVKYAVLSYGGVLGMGDRLFAVPIDRFQPRAGSEKLILNIDKDQLKSAPGFDKEHWPSMADPSWDKDIQSFYGGSKAPTDTNRDRDHDMTTP